ncbi:hypothetical protein FNU79_02080 [Deinococcus detaillensis]|uniref:Uncharacterized protein n=1 Tax=Deinococcus detaillensis TaxID=2592048 RepID=A0A553V6E8_9DEIO|nr:hypothetical protein [Deinococcus detaillensis]TSA88039.1 hypothetical protein FNU79_02080 [Deinococcus detaillensis]
MLRWLITFQRGALGPVGQYWEVGKLASGLSNKLTGQIGEFLVCAEMGRQLDLVAAPFAGNVPAFDLLVADEQCRSVAIQVKAARGTQWPSRADSWLKLTVVDGDQIDGGDQEIDHPNLIYVFVAIAPRGAAQQSDNLRDRFFILTKRDVQGILTAAYRKYMKERKIPWHRPHNPASFDARIDASQMTNFEDNWELVRHQLAAQTSA